MLCCADDVRAMAGGADLLSLPAVHLPFSLASLVMRGAWGRVLCLARWLLPWQDQWPPAEWCNANVDRHEVVDASSGVLSVA
eukprot:11088540-Alexandrium_andersonii.AAC.1